MIVHLQCLEYERALEALKQMLALASEFDEVANRWELQFLTHTFLIVSHWQNADLMK